MHHCCISSIFGKQIDSLKKKAKKTETIFWLGMEPGMPRFSSWYLGKLVLSGGSNGVLGEVDF